ncbi:MAG: YncE family protein [Acidimicrobiia bacterium]
MTRPSLQLGLAAIALAAFTWVGIATLPPGPSPALAGPGVAAGAVTTTAPTTTTGMAPAITVTTTLMTTLPTTEATVADAARDLSLAVHPDGAAATLTVTDTSGRPITGDGQFDGSVIGAVEVMVEAEGFHTETLEIPAERAGEVQVWLDPPDQVVDRRLVIGTGSAPKQVAFTPDGSELWVTLLGGSGLEAYDPVTGELIAAIDLPEAGSVEVIFDSAGKTAYVSQMETASVYEVDVATHELMRQLVTGGSWTKVMVLSPDERRLWASNWVSNDVSEFDLTSGEMVRRIPTVTTPRGLALNPAGTKLYVAGYDEGDIEVVDLASGESSTIHHSGGALRHLAADKEDGLIYASDMALDTIFVIDTATDSVTTMGSTDRLPNTIDLSPDGRVLAVSNRGRNNPETYYLPGPEWGSVLLLDTATGAILDAIVGGNQPTGLDISPDGAWLAYSDFLDNRVSVIALPDTEVLLAAGGGRSETYGSELTK